MFRGESWRRTKGDNRDIGIIAEWIEKRPL
jgi:hypothetical protein